MVSIHEKRQRSKQRSSEHDIKRARDNIQRIVIDYSRGDLKSTISLFHMNNGKHILDDTGYLRCLRYRGIKISEVKSYISQTSYYCLEFYFE